MRDHISEGLGASRDGGDACSLRYTPIRHNEPSISPPDVRPAAFPDVHAVRDRSSRRGPRQEGEQPVLTVNVHSKTEDLGPIWLKTQLMNAQQIELTMWAVNESVVSQARSRSYLLGDELRAAGLNLRAFSVVHGERPTELSDWAPTGRGLVVDVSA